MDVFFAHPYHSWERGTNENANGLIRRLYPKKSSFAGIGRAEIKRIDAFLNDRPRKCLGWSTPREELAAFLESLGDLTPAQVYRGTVLVGRRTWPSPRTSLLGPPCAS